MSKYLALLALPLPLRKLSAITVQLLQFAARRGEGKGGEKRRKHRRSVFLSFFFFFFIFLLLFNPLIPPSNWWNLLFPSMDELVAIRAGESLFLRQRTVDHN